VITPKMSFKKVEVQMNSRLGMPLLLYSSKPRLCQISIKLNIIVKIPDFVCRYINWYLLQSVLLLRKFYMIFPDDALVKPNKTDAIGRNVSDIRKYSYSVSECSYYYKLISLLFSITLQENIVYASAQLKSRTEIHRSRTLDRLTFTTEASNDNNKCIYTCIKI
jgi:hypothetical protein